MNYFENLADNDLISAYEEMNEWGGNPNPQPVGVLEEIKQKYISDGIGIQDLYIIMQVDLFSIMAKKWYDENSQRM